MQNYTTLFCQKAETANRPFINAKNLLTSSCYCFWVTMCDRAMHDGLNRLLLPHFVTQHN